MNPMKLSHLLSQRPELLRQLRLANMAYAFNALTEFAQRVARARLQGRVVLKPIEPQEERYCVSLTALEMNQSLIEEHFSEDDLIVLADVLGYATGHPAHELAFQLEQLGEFIDPLRTELERSGIQLDSETSKFDAPRRRSS